MSLRNRRDAIPALFSRWRQRWWLILGCLAACLIAAGIYLATATPIYQVTSLVMVERTRPVAKTDLPPDEFLASQKSLLLSLPGAKEQPLDVVTDKGEGTITISTESEHPQTAAVTLTSLTNAYLQAAGGQQSSVARKLGDLAVERDKRAAGRTAKATALDNFKKQNNITGAATDNVIAARRDQLAAALTAAQTEAAAAKANADAAANLPTDPAKLVAILNVARNAGVFNNLETERAQTQDQLSQLETQLAKQRETLGAQHPLILQTQKKIDLLSAHLADLKNRYPDVYRAYCTQQLTATTNKVNELKVLLDQQTQRNSQASSSQQQLQQLEGDVKDADAAIAEIDKQIRDTTLNIDSGVRMKLVQMPRVPEYPSRPQRTPILIAAAGIGLLLGLALASIGGRRG